MGHQGDRNALACSNDVGFGKLKAGCSPNGCSRTHLQLDSGATEPHAAKILRGLGFSQSMIDGKYTQLSGGWKSRCTLATALLVQSDVLLLDEPSNFLVGIDM